MLLDVVLEKLYFVVAERDGAFRPLAVLQRCLLIGPMTDIETPIVDIEILDIERPECAESNSSVPE